MAPGGGDALPLKVHGVKLVYICVKKMRSSFSSLVFVLNKGTG